MPPPVPPAFAGGGLNILEKSLLGGGGRVRNFYFGVGGSYNFDVKIKIA